MTAILRSRIRTIFSLILIFTIFTPLLSACDKSISGSEVVYGYFGLLFTSIFQGEPGGLLYALIFTPFVVGVFAIVVHVIVHLIAYVDKPKPYTIKYLIIALVSYSLFLVISLVFGIHLLWGYWATLISLVGSIMFEQSSVQAPEMTDTS